jgi:hypothetical protein
MNHIKGRESNLRLQRSIKKYGLKSFKIVIYYFHTDPAVLLTDIETIIISSFPFSSLFNFKKEANSMFRKTHNKCTKNLMSIKKSINLLGLYDKNNNIIEKYSNQVKLANKFNVHKITIYRYIKSGKLFKGKFYIKEIKN